MLKKSYVKFHQKTIKGLDRATDRRTEIFSKTQKLKPVFYDATNNSN